MANGTGLPWRDILEKHGFGAVVALILLAALLGLFPTPLSQLAAHVDRDVQRETMTLAVCLNIAELTAAVKTRVGPEDRDQAFNRCWDAMYGTGPLSQAIRQLSRQKSQRD